MMEYQLVAQFSKKHYEAITLREEVLGGKTNLLKEHDLTVYVAIEDDKVIGTAAIQLYPFGIARIRQVAVAPDCQGRKVGSQLLKRCEAFAREQKHARVILSGRKSASSFYLKQDYRIWSIPFKKHDISFLWMTKNVEDSLHSVS